MTFEKFLQDSVGGNYPLRDMLDNLEVEQIVESINEYASLMASVEVINTKHYILETAKENRIFESGTDKVGFIYITQLEQLCD